MSRHILEEVSLVASAEMESLWTETTTEEGAGGSHAAPATKEQLSVPALEAFVSQVMSDTAANTSSMLQDVRARRRTEVRYLNGYVAAKGAEHGIACPWNREMCRRVEELLP